MRVKLFGGQQDGLELDVPLADNGEPPGLIRIPRTDDEGLHREYLLYECPQHPVRGVWRYRLVGSWK